jgi:hypothetical protein
MHGNEKPPVREAFRFRLFGNRCLRLVPTRCDLLGPTHAHHCSSRRLLQCPGFLRTRVDSRNSHLWLAFPLALSDDDRRTVRRISDDNYKTVIFAADFSKNPISGDFLSITCGKVPCAHLACLFPAKEQLGGRTGRSGNRRGAP